MSVWWKQRPLRLVLWAAQEREEAGKPCETIEEDFGFSGAWLSAWSWPYSPRLRRRPEPMTGSLQSPDGPWGDTLTAAHSRPGPASTRARCRGTITLLPRRQCASLMMFSSPGAHSIWRSQAHCSLPRCSAPACSSLFGKAGEWCDRVRRRGARTPGRGPSRGLHRLTQAPRLVRPSPKRIRARETLAALDQLDAVRTWQGFSVEIFACRELGGVEVLTSVRHGFVLVYCQHESPTRKPRQPGTQQAPALDREAGFAWKVHARCFLSEDGLEALAASRRAASLDIGGRPETVRSVPICRSCPSSASRRE
jgi:hypothetical protein